MKRIVILMVLFLMMLSIGCGSVTPTPPTDIPVSIEGVDGQTEVGVTSSFKYTFSEAPDPDTVNGDTFYMYPTSEGDEGRIDAEIEQDTSVSYILTPASPLNGGTNYTIAILLTLITDMGGNPLAAEDLRVSFTTEGPSVTDADGNNLGSVITGINPTTFTLTFAEAMDAASVTTAGNITFTCVLPDGSSLAQPTIDVSASGSGGSIYTVAVEDADGNTPFRYQLLNCTLTITSSVMDSSGNALSNDISYSFTNGCALNDDFNVDSQSCWSVADYPAYGLTNWPDVLANNLTFDPSDSAIDYYNNAGEMFVIYKPVVVSPDGFEITIHFKSAASFTSVFYEVSLMLSQSLDLTNPTKYLTVEMGSVEGQACASYYGTGWLPISGYSASCAGTDQDYYIKVTVSDAGVVRSYYSTDGESYSNMVLQGEYANYPVVDFNDGTNYIMMYFGDQTNRATAVIDEIITTGITSDGQY